MTTIDTMLREDRRFPPPEAFAGRAVVGSLDELRRLHEESLERPEEFWGRMAGRLDWVEPWDRVLEWDPPHARWFLGGRINVSANCLDRHLGARAERIAIRWEGEPPGERRDITYGELHGATARFAGALRGLGLEPGDRVAIYMPMVPELAIAMLACSRIGLVHSVIFGGFSAEAIKDRVQDAGARAVITADGGWRRGRLVPLKANVDRAMVHCPTVERVIVLRRTGAEVRAVVQLQRTKAAAATVRIDRMTPDCLFAAPPTPNPLPPISSRKTRHLQ